MIIWSRYFIGLNLLDTHEYEVGNWMLILLY